MEVILKQDVDKLGMENELVKVRPGYARNFLIPRGLAVLVTEGSRKQLAEREKQSGRREEQLLKQLGTVQEKLKNTVLRIGAKSGTSGKIFGSVTTHMISDAIKKQINVVVDRKKITLPEDVSMIGTYTAHVNLHKEVSVDVAFEVIAE